MHELFLRRCLQLAVRAAGHTAPNPLVGAVVVHNGRIIAEGWHMHYGGPHAEVHAIRAVADRSLLPHCTLYVNLEPCCHYGKTPPCTNLILESGIRNIVAGPADPSPQVGGKGFEQLLRSGCALITDVLHEECRQLNRRFYTFHEKSRPYVVLKWAQSADGFLGRRGERTPLSSEAAQVLAHRWRSEEAAVLVGTQTALVDNPQLTVRLWRGRQPMRIVLDRHGRLPHALHLFDGSAPTLLVTENPLAKPPHAEPLILPFERLLPALLEALWQRGVLSLLVEGGSRLLQAFLDHGLWDEARQLVSPVRLGDGVAAPVIHAAATEEHEICADRLFLYRNSS
ncbi:MAG: bifunctional diaminohydroxyphosphoribosylaminopyrimidine deaminase/5-amino-6-(5-phosphoribosylamino)uracil reductase RibD [Chitinophagales bacterium]|nr:bifunctional diaminohydroxyphosphoribosylaminopyrimidine deaminase/5-amino-6-(5-phosphoribosylamino)uracil reductase RibD [Chitinophagales bacterium]MDW8393412.1 bifunctional diaminohydroxyphosphoribosylaminopyrimidine deaminase/5-amino-6-(5-phosphoribosylamino)uracil reductase RibD [Chitinophagales bacterium]